MRSGDQGAIAKTSGFGFSFSSATVSIGWFQNTNVSLDQGCHVVLIGNSDEQLRRFAVLTQNTRSICADKVLGGERQ